MFHKRESLEAPTKECFTSKPTKAEIRFMGSVLGALEVSKYEFWWFCGFGQHGKKGTIGYAITCWGSSLTASVTLATSVRVTLSWIGNTLSENRISNSLINKFKPQDDWSSSNRMNYKSRIFNWGRKKFFCLSLGTMTQNDFFFGSPLHSIYVWNLAGLEVNYTSRERNLVPFIYAVRLLQDVYRMKYYAI